MREGGEKEELWETRLWRRPTPPTRNGWSLYLMLATVSVSPFRLPLTVTCLPAIGTTLS